MCSAARVNTPCYVWRHFFFTSPTLSWFRLWVRLPNLALCHNGGLKTIISWGKKSHWFISAKNKHVLHFCEHCYCSPSVFFVIHFCRLPYWWPKLECVIGFFVLFFWKIYIYIHIHTCVCVLEDGRWTHFCQYFIMVSTYWKLLFLWQPNEWFPCLYNNVLKYMSVFLMSIFSKCHKCAERAIKTRFE